MQILCVISLVRITGVGEIPSEYCGYDTCFPCKGKLYSTARAPLSSKMVSYDPYTNSWMQLPPLKDCRYWSCFVRNEDEVYALLYSVTNIGFISRYKPESHSWEDLLSLKHFHSVKERKHFSVVASDYFIYFFLAV